MYTAGFQRFNLISASVSQFLCALVSLLQGDTTNLSPAQSHLVNHKLLNPWPWERSSHYQLLPCLPFYRPMVGAADICDGC